MTPISLPLPAFPTGSGLAIVRLRALLETVPAHRLADLFSAAFEEARRPAPLGNPCSKPLLETPACDRGVPAPSKDSKCLRIFFFWTFAARPSLR